MKVTASEVFKGKKANYEPSIPEPFSAHRLGTVYCWYCYNLMIVLLTLLLRMRITRMMTMVVVFVTISYIHFTDITQDVLKQNVSANKQIVPSSENIWVSLQL